MDSTILKFDLRRFLRRDRPSQGAGPGRADCHWLWNPHRWERWSDPREETWIKGRYGNPNFMYVRGSAKNILDQEYARWAQTRKCLKCGKIERRHLEG